MTTKTKKKKTAARKLKWVATQYTRGGDLVWLSGDKWASSVPAFNSDGISTGRICTWDHKSKRAAMAACEKHSQQPKEPTK